MPEGFTVTVPGHSGMDPMNAQLLPTSAVLANEALPTGVGRSTASAALCMKDKNKTPGGCLVRRICGHSPLGGVARASMPPNFRPTINARCIF